MLAQPAKWNSTNSAGTRGDTIGFVRSASAELTVSLRRLGRELKIVEPEFTANRLRRDALDVQDKQAMKGES